MAARARLASQKGADGPLLEPPAVSPDGRQVAFNLRRRGRITLHVMNVEGGGIRPLAESLDVRDAGSWSPDGQWVAIGGNDGKGAVCSKFRRQAALRCA